MKKEYLNNCVIVNMFLFTIFGFYVWSFNTIYSDSDKSIILIADSNDCDHTMAIFSVEIQFITLACLKVLNQIENVDLIRMHQKYYLSWCQMGSKIFICVCVKNNNYLKPQQKSSPNQA